MNEWLSARPSDLDPRIGNRLLTSVVVPRPIAWVSTVGADGTRNLAPFSYFNAVANNPPVVMISVSERTGQQKDTLRNVKDTRELVISLVDEANGAEMNQTSIEAPYDVDEIQFAAVAMAPSVDVKPERVSNSPVSIECQVTQIVPVEGTTYTVVFGRIVRWHLRRDVLKPNGLVDAEKLRPIARLGGDEYSTIGRLFEMPRPRWPR